ncbi:MAG: DnaJ domain-containing protein [Chitinophagaceae bacterium]
MATKDYYQILDIPYTATGEDIRRAFRKLAFEWHPDKNGGDVKAEEKFKELQEAYFILNDPGRRETYHLKSSYPLINRKHPPKPVTVQGILYQCKRLNDQIAEMDIFRMSQQALFDQIMLLLSDKNRSIIHQSGDEAIRQQIITELLKSSTPLAFSFVEQINSKLAQLAGSNNETISYIYQQTKKRKQFSYWERYNGLIIFVATLLLCLLIWVMNR